jgi:hypothetical protein
MVDKVKLLRVFLPALQYYLASIIPLIILSLSFSTTDPLILETQSILQTSTGTLQNMTLKVGHILSTIINGT